MDITLVPNDRVETMTNDETIDLVLSKIYNEVTFNFKIKFQVILTTNDLKLVIRLKNDMEAKGLIKQHDPNGRSKYLYEVTGLGNDIFRAGGWLKHIETQSHLDDLARNNAAKIIHMTISPPTPAEKMQSPKVWTLSNVTFVLLTGIVITVLGGLVIIYWTQILDWIKTI